VVGILEGIFEGLTVGGTSKVVGWVVDAGVEVGSPVEG
jgi:hypothetical protein